MKVVVSNNDNQKPKPILSLIDDDGKEQVPKTKLRAYDLYTNPADVNSAKHKMSIRTLDGTESLRTTLKWRVDIDTILAGLALTNSHTACSTIIRQLLEGAAKAAHIAMERKKAENTRITAAEAARTLSSNNNESDAQQAAAYRGVMVADLSTHYDADGRKASLDSVVKNVCPPKALQKVKRFLRRDCRKPRDLKIREFYARVMHINNVEIPMLPPFGPNQPIGNDEMVDILVHACPSSWQRELDRQGYDPDQMSLAEVISLFEGIEQSENFDGNGNHNKSNNNNNKSSKKGGKPGQKSSGGGGKHCMLHGDCGHTTEECRTMQSQAKRLKSGGGGSGSGNSGNKSYGNKTWSRNADDAKKKALKEINAFAKAAYAKHFEANAVQSEDEDSNKRGRSDDESEADMNMVEEHMFDMDITDEQSV